MINLNSETSFGNLQIRNNFTTDIPNTNTINHTITINTNNGLINSNHNNNNRGREILVEKLVDATSFIIETIWCNFPVISTAQIIPLRLFIIETLKRSRTFLSTLKIAQLYLLRIKSKITSLHSVAVADNNRNNNNNNNVDHKNVDPATCGRRMFLASLIVASKFLQDKNYSNSAWSKICGLQVKEINIIERRFLQLIAYNLYISENLFDNWTSLLNSRLDSKIFASLDTLNDDNNNDSRDDVVYYNSSSNNANANGMNVHGNINSNGMSMSVRYSDSINSIHNSNNINSNISSAYGFGDPNSSIVLPSVITMTQSKECRVKG